MDYLVSGSSMCLIIQNLFSLRYSNIGVWSYQLVCTFLHVVHQPKLYVAKRLQRINTENRHYTTVTGIGIRRHHRPVQHWLPSVFVHAIAYFVSGVPCFSNSNVCDFFIYGDIIYAQHGGESQAFYYQLFGEADLCKDLKLIKLQLVSRKRKGEDTTLIGPDLTTMAAQQVSQIMEVVNTLNKSYGNISSSDFENNIWKHTSSHQLNWYWLMWLKNISWV